MIVSASRRTDIPAFYTEWFMNRLKEGYVLTRNPMNHSQISKIPLSRDTVDCFVFWTKDPLPMSNKLKLLDEQGFSYYFQFTLTPYGSDMEVNLRNKNEIIYTFIELSRKIGKNKVLWRYDPIILNKDITHQYHIEKFTELCKKLSGYTEYCTISFVDLYKKLSKNIINQVILPISDSDMIALASEFAKIGKFYNIKVRSCCEKLDLSRYGVSQGSCIDPYVIEAICGYSLEVKRDANQRQGCGCIQSVDIGVYNTCKNGCIYCYANYSLPSAIKNFEQHDPRSPILLGTVKEDEKIIEKNKNTSS